MEEIEKIPMDDEDVGVQVEEVEAQCVDTITQLPEYVPPSKPKTKVPKDIDENKTPLQLLYFRIILFLTDQA